MTGNGWLQILLFFAVVLALTPPIGAFLHRVMEGKKHVLLRPLRWLEELIYRACGVDRGEQRWTAYALSLLAFSAATMIVTYVIQRVQHLLPFNPQHLGPVEAASAFNTAASFTTNTNWQGYAGETTMSYLSQMAGLAWHNFTSAAAGIAVAIALARGITRRGDGSGPGTIGNFWVDLTRATVYVLLPLSFVFALFFVSQGVIQNLAPYREVTTLEGGKQLLAMGPVASQEAIKQLGTNGGGFFNVNAAHPFENPTPLTNFVSMILIFLIPAGLTFTFGRMAGNAKQGWALFGAMAVLFLAGVAVAYAAESASGGVNAMHDSFTPLGGLVPLFNIQLGEVVFGGVGAGLYGMLVMAILSVFIAGLMVGRTPEYLGKKIETREVKLAMLYVLVFPLVILALSAWSAVAPYGVSSLANAGPHGLSEILYACTSAAGNNGSAFAGLNANTPWYNMTLGLAMLAGRFLMIVPALAIAGILAGKKSAPGGPGTLPTTGPLFVALLVGVIVIVGALTFFPALSLSPVVEHFLMRSGQVY
jgi:K+-transporting ATPase ATPase A chain